MRKLFFSLMAAACALTANAQVEPASGTAYYLYNTESGQFLTRGKNWGTQAIVETVGLPWQVTIADGKYKLQMLDLVKAGSTTGLGSNGFTDNGSPVTLTPTGDAEGYTLPLGVNADNTINMSGTGTWQFLTTEQYRALQATKTTAQNAAIAHAAGFTGELLATITNTNEYASKDLSSKIPAVNNTNWAPTKNGSRGGNQNQGNYGVESYQTGDATYSCTVTDLQPGVYKVGIKALHRTASNAADLAVGNAGYDCSSAYLDANGYRVAIKDWYSSRTGDGVPNSVDQFVTIANNGGYYSEVYTYVGEDGKLNLKAAATSYWGGCWFLMNSLTLTYYTDQVSDEDAEAIINSVPTTAMAADLQAALEKALSDFENDKTIANYNALQAAIDAAKPSVEAYAAAKAIADGAKAKAVAAAVTVDASAFDNAYTAGTLKGSTEAEAYASAVQTAIENKIKGLFDKTGKIDDPSFESGNLDAWTNDGFGNPATNKNFKALTGNLFMEKWVGSGGKLANGSLKQTLSNLPAGEYVLTVDAKNEQQATATAEKGAFVVIGSKRYEINSATVDHCAVALTIEEESDVEIGIVLEGCTGNWVCFDNFKLYASVVEEEDIFALLETIPDTPYNHDIQQNVEIAQHELENDPSIANYNALVDLIAQAQASAKIYEEIWTALNWNTPDNPAYADALSDIYDAYNDGTITDGKAELKAIQAAFDAEWAKVYVSIEAGDYVLQNVETGKYLGAANEWGTQASLLSRGIMFNIEAVADGKYTLDSHIANSATQHYLNGTFTDQNATPFALIEVEGGYALTTDNHTFLTSPDGKIVDLSSKNMTGKAVWNLISKTDLYRMMTEATDADPVDVTVLVKDANFDRNNTNYSAWVWSWGEKNNNKNHKNAGNDPEAGGNVNFVVESFHAQFAVSQVVKVPNGFYTVTAQGFYRQDGQDNVHLPYFFANDAIAEVPVMTGTEDSMNDAANAFKEGKYKIEGLNVVVDDGILNIGVSNMENDALWVIFDNFEVTCTGMLEDDLRMTIGEAGWATFVAPFDVEVPAEVNAYKVTDLKGDELVLESLTTIPANTPVVLEGDEYDKYVSGYSFAEPAVAGLLTGVYADTKAPVKSYVLQSHNDVVGFYQVKEGAEPTVPANHAYLQAKASDWRILSFGEQTAIKTIDALTSGKAEIYDLNGRQLSRLQKGINIVNGAKVLVK